MSETFKPHLMRNEVLSKEASEALHLEYAIAPPTHYGPVVRFLSSLRISHRIYALVALSLFMLGAVTTTQYVADQTIIDTEAKSNTLRTVNQNIKDIQQMLLRMEVANVSFYTRPKASQNNFDKARTEADQLGESARVSWPANTQDIGALLQDISNLNAAFTATNKARITLGLNDKQGLRATLKNASAVIENELAIWPNVSDFNARMTKLHRYEQSFLVTSSKSDAGKIRKTLNELDFAISGGPFGMETRKKLTLALKTYSKAIRAYVAAVKVRIAAETSFTQNLDDAQNRAQTLTQKATSALSDAQKHGQETREKTKNTLTILLIASMALFTALAFIIANSIHKPISAIRNAMNTIAAGDSSVRVPGLSRRDEIGAMARSIALFKHTAQEIHKIRAQEQDNKDTAERNRRKSLMSLAENFENTVHKVAENVQKSAKNISITAKTLSKDTQTTRQQGADMSESINGAAASMDMVVSSSEELLNTVNSVEKRLSESSQSINNANQGAEVVTNRINALSQAANDIGNVVGLINEIAERTNLLALNATIEAARAGDAGKGFAVVANEVKQLANQTQSATSNISKQIKLIQDDIKQTIDAISDVCKDISMISGLTERLNSAVQTQNTASQNIKAQVQRAAEGTEAVSTSLQSMKNAINASSTSADEVTETVQELSQQSEQLETELKAFIQNIHAL